MPVANGIPSRLKAATFENFDLKLNRPLAKALLRCQEVAEGTAWCALLFGSPGLGKSHLAAAALQDSRHPRPGYFWNFGELLRHIRHMCFDDNGPKWAEEYALESTAKARGLLVLDDVGAEKATEWANQTLYGLLNSRYEARLPTIVTTNNIDAIDDRVLSRYYEGTVVCEGQDVRRLKQNGAST